jgi:hypothetical protein
MALRSAYRLAKSFDRAQSWVRGRLLARVGLENASQAGNRPSTGLIDDLSKAFAGGCPVAEFQLAFQQGFFAPEPQRARRTLRSRRR